MQYASKGDNNNNNNKALIPKFWNWLWILNRLIMVSQIYSFLSFSSKKKKKKKYRPRI